ncbi:MAG: hypothetical protein LAT67_09135 [Balneolales bacterium]|nr:hypothetical protein [Balneolales bacterium]
MSSTTPYLGICFSGNALYYSVRQGDAGHKFSYIGKADFNFPVFEAFTSADTERMAHINKVVRRVCEKHSVSSVRVVSFPHFECWTMLPKLAYDDSKEREAHLSFLAYGVERKNIETTWFETSNRDFRFLSIRDQTVVQLLNRCTQGVADTEYCTDFEVGLSWMKHHGARGSLMTLGCNDHILTISSYILGKLRSATCIRYKHLNDLIFEWKQSETHLKWVSGYHEEILVYGADSDEVVSRLQPLWDNSAQVRRINSLADIGVEAEEETYSFPLQEAFPALMMALK